MFLFISDYFEENIMITLQKNFYCIILSYINIKTLKLISTDKIIANIFINTCLSESQSKILNSKFLNVLSVLL